MSQRYIEYWRRSIVERALGKGTFSEKELEKLQSHQKIDAAWQLGQIPGDTTNKYFAQVDDEITQIKITLWPYVHLLKSESGQSTGALPRAVAPLAVQVMLDRSGFLYPTGKAVISRSLLEPIPKGSIAVGKLGDFDNHITHNPTEGLNSRAVDGEPDHEDAWIAFKKYCDEMLNVVAGDWIKHPAPYVKATYCIASGESDISFATRGIVSLLDHLREKKTVPKLLNRITQTTENKTCVNPPSNPDTFSVRSGHFTSAYSLKPLQRYGLSAALVAQDGEVVALNGPPGTGKTTLLLAVIASTMVNRAVANSQPALVVACSTNNQAITNILDAFATGFEHDNSAFGQRWLPSINSYGSYFPSNAKQNKADEDDYQTTSFFDRVETTEYFNQAESSFLIKAANAFDNNIEKSLGNVITKLHSELCRNQNLLDSVLTCYRKFEASVQALSEVIPNITLDETSEQAIKRMAHWAKAKKAWEQYRASESIFFSLFSWLPPVRKKRELRTNLFLRELLPEHKLDATDHETVSKWLDSVEALTQCHYRERETVKKLASTLNSDGADLDVQTIPTLEEFDEACDVTLRFKQFQLASRYWEARWLDEMTKVHPYLQEQRQKRGRKTIASRWRRRMMLTPCSVMTFFKAPENFLVRIFQSESSEFLDDYLFDEIDLLIVDEAGQAGPDIAGATFALAKKALVVGDCRQLKPIAVTTSGLDYQTCIETGLAESLDNYEDLDSLGVTVASGSILKHAQVAGRYHQVKTLDRGLYLLEHRRCYDEIIGYCNQLSYQGELQPRRGPAPGNSVVPALGLAHVDGICETNSTNSRLNRLEADAVVSWIKQNLTKLEARYELPLEKIVAVVTPFAAQTALVQKGLKDAGVTNATKLTVGTVHSLQGAERPVIIFSQVYSVHADGGFIDQDTTMLNVAVSRAKDSFLVFGDLHVMSGASGSTPRRQLYEWMVGHGTVELNYGELSPRADLIDVRARVPVSQLVEFDQHYQFLQAVLAGNHSEIHIVSPFVRHQTMQSGGAYDLLADAVCSGKSVNVYADRHFTDSLKSGPPTDHFETVSHNLQKRSVGFHEVQRVHSKLVVADRDIYCVGSFNWFSASRNLKYANQETSIVYRGSSLVSEIDARLADLRKRTIARN